MSPKGEADCRPHSAMRNIYKKSFLLLISAYPFIPVIYGIDLGYNIPYFSYKRLFFLVLFAIGIIFRYLRAPLSRAFSNKYVMIAAIFLILNSALSDYRQLSLNSSLSMLFEWMFIAFILVSELKDKQSRIFFLTCLSIGIIISVALGGIEAYSNYNPIYHNFVQSNNPEANRVLYYDYSYLADLSMRMRRIYSLFNHPYQFSNIGVIGYALFLGAFLTYRKRYYLFISFLSISAIIMGGGRASAAYFVMVNIFFMFMSWKSLPSKTMKIFAGQIMTLILIIVLFPTSRAYFQIFSKDNFSDARYGSTFADYEMMYRGALSLANKRPLLGYGLQVPRLKLFYREDQWNAYKLGQIESSWLNWLLSVGYGGICLMLLIYWKLCVIFYRQFRYEANIMALPAYSLLMGAAIIDLIATQSQYLFIAIILGFCWNDRTGVITS